MKAKEMLAIYDASPSLDTLYKLMEGMMKEFADVDNSRNIKTLPGLFGQIDEFSQRWAALIRLIGNPEYDPNGFINIVKDRSPDLYVEWVNYKERLEKRK